MPLPAPLVGLTIDAKQIAADSSPVVGATITLTPTVPARSPAGDVLIAPKALPKTTDSSGVAQWTNLLASDSPGLSNRVPYLVTVVDSAGFTIEAPYVVELLSSQAVAGVLRLDDVAPAAAPSTVVSYLLAALLGQVGGPAGPLDAGGKVPAAQLPAAGGSIPATIVDAKGDLVAATANDTPARHPVGTNGQALLADSAQSTGLRWATLAVSDLPGLQTTLDGKVAVALIDAKGDLLVGTANDTAARLAVGADGRLLMADSSQAGGMRWSTRTAPGYDPAMDGLIAVNGDPAIFRSNFALGAAGGAARVLVPAGVPITGGLVCAHSAGVLGAGGVNGFAVNDDSGTLIASTVDDNNLWLSTGVRNKAFPSPVAAQTTDRYVYVSIRVTGYSTPPGFAFTDGSTPAARLDGLLSGKRRYLLLSGSAWGAIDPVNGSSGAGFMPFIALY